MANLNSGQDVAIKRERNRQLHSYSGRILYLYQAVGMSFYGSLININPLCSASGNKSQHEKFFFSKRTKKTFFMVLFSRLHCYSCK